MNWKWGIVMTILAIVTLISIVYAFVQTVKAQAAERVALGQKTSIEEQMKMAEATRAEALRQHALYIQCQQN